MIISMIVAIGMNNEIGKGGDLLWVLPKDMAHFKNITWGHHILTGRKSYQSIPAKYRPLAGRTNIVVSRDASAKDHGEDELMIIGGGEIYKLALHLTDRIYLTRVHHAFQDADTFFPILSNHDWQEVSIELIHADEKHKYDFEFVELRRIS